MHILVDCGSLSLLLSVRPEWQFSDLVKVPALSEILGNKRHDMWWQVAGKRCQSTQRLSEAGVSEGCLVQAHLRLRGGGGDGGATGAESRSSYLEMYMKKKPDKVDPAEERLAIATNCKLSGERLKTPCVVDELGSLYNKEAIVTALVSKTIPKAIGHISSLKHVRDVRLEKSGTASEPDDNDVQYQCPVTGLPLNGQYKFCVVFPSGMVVSEKAAKQIPSAVEELTGGPWAELIPLNGNQEELEVLWDKLIATRAAAKKSKRNKINVALVVDGTSAVSKQANLESRSSSGEHSNGTKKRKDRPKQPIQDFTVEDAAAIKRVKAVDLAPTHADRKVWASLFTSSHRQPTKETYSCRSTSGRGWM